MKGHNIGRGVSLWLAFQRAEHAAHEDVDAFDAPGECHVLVEKFYRRRERLVRRHIRGVTGLPFDLFCREVRRRTSPHVAHFICQL